MTEDLEGESKSEKDTSPTDVVENEWSDAQRMLFEFSKLGKVCYCFLWGALHHSVRELALCH